MSMTLGEAVFAAVAAFFSSRCGASSGAQCPAQLCNSASASVVGTATKASTPMQSSRIGAVNGLHVPVARAGVAVTVANMTQQYCQPGPIIEIVGQPE